MCATECSMRCHARRNGHAMCVARNSARFPATQPRVFCEGKIMKIVILIYHNHILLLFQFKVVPFFQKQGIIKYTEFFLKPDDFIMMSSNVHEWKSKPRSIVWYQCLMQQIIKNKVTPKARMPWPRLVQILI